MFLENFFTDIFRPLRLGVPSTSLRTCFAGDNPRLTGARSAPYENFLLSDLCAFAPLREIFRFSVAALPHWAVAMNTLSR
jgi:hypothetical protein